MAGEDKPLADSRKSALEPLAMTPMPPAMRAAEKETRLALAIEPLTVVVRNERGEVMQVQRTTPTVQVQGDYTLPTTSATAMVG